MTKTSLTLFELNTQIKNILDTAFMSTVWITAEVGECTVNRNGHCYLELVDTDENQVTARVRANIWAYTFRMLKPHFETVTGQTFSTGIKVLVQVKVEFHQVYGMSLNIKDIDPAYTLGDMALKRREIISRLKEAGIFDQNKQLELPLVPQRVAIISSPTAAGLQDFMNQLNDNQLGVRFRTRLFAATMQGAETASSVINALDEIQSIKPEFDVVAIIRGGGSQLDLASFDNYDLAAKIASFPLPVITGIGHDKDETVVDMVAHTKMKTPTAVAEFLINGAGVFIQKLIDFEEICSGILRDRFQKETLLLRQMNECLKQSVSQMTKEEGHRFDIAAIRLKNVLPTLQKLQHRLMQSSHQLDKTGTEILRSQTYLLGRKTNSLPFQIRQIFNAQKSYLQLVGQGIGPMIKEKMSVQSGRLSVFEGKVNLIDPVKVLQRGYSLTYHNGRLVRSVNDLKNGELMITKLADGEITSRHSKGDWTLF